MFHFSGEEIASIAVVAGFVVLYFRTVKDRNRERRERIELKNEVSELAAQLLKALREQEKSALKVSKVTEQLDKARQEQIEMQEKFRTELTEEASKSPGGSWESGNGRAAMTVSSPVSPSSLRPEVR